MRQIDITNKNKDLDLRRFGKDIYSKAEKSDSSDGDNEGGSGGDNSDDGGDDGSGNLLMSLIPSDCPKPTLFLYRTNDEDNNPIDFTNYKIDDLLSFWEQGDSDFTIMCLYESSDLNPAIVSNITFGIDGPVFFSIDYISNDTVSTIEVSYNNKLYYYYCVSFG